MQELTAEKVMPYKILEERMIKYKRECDERARKEIESEVARVRDIEISHVRLEEAASYRSKIAEFRNEIDSMHKEKIKELRVREAEILERCKIKEREIEAAAFEHRQKVLKDLETLRFKDQDSKKTVEMELIVIKNTREQLMQKEKEADLKLKDLNLLKVALEKKSQSEIDEYRRKIDSQRDDERRELQVRRMQLEEDEHRFHLNKEKFLNSEKTKTQLEKENFTLKDELEALKITHDKMTSEHHDIRDQLKVLSNNGLRDNEIINSKTSQVENYQNEAKTLRELLEAQKDQLRSEKDTNKEIIQNLNIQIKNLKEDTNSLKQRYANELERIVKESEYEKDGYKKVHDKEQNQLKREIDLLNHKVEVEQQLSKELTIHNDKLTRDRNDINNRYQIDSIQRDDYLRGDVARVGIRHHDFLTNNGIPLVEGMTDPQLGEEYVERQRVWSDLENASRDVKRNINKIGLLPTPEISYVPNRYDIEKDETPLDDYESDERRDEAIRFDTYKSPEKPSNPVIKKSPEKKKPAIDYAEIERIERERREKEDREKKDYQKRQDEIRRQDELRRKEDQRRQDELKRQEEKRKREESKVQQPTSSHISSSVLNPFAKKKGGNKRLDPIADKPATTYGYQQDNYPKPQKTSSAEAEGDIQDNYDFNFGDRNKDPGDDSIKESISEKYSDFEEVDQLEYNF